MLVHYISLEGLYRHYT